MRAKKVNAISLEMEKINVQVIDLLAQNAHCKCYTMCREWFSDFILMYGLTIALSNDTYIKSSLKTFTSFIVPEIENKGNIQSIVDGMNAIINLLS